MNHESTLFLYQFISISAIIRGAAHRSWGSLFATLVATLISWERSLQRRGSQSSDPWEFPDCQMALACFSCHVLARSIFFSATQLFRYFCKKAAKKSPWVVWRYQASRSRRFAELHTAHFCQPRNLRRWVVRTVVQLVRGYIWMPFRGMNRFIIEDIEYTAWLTKLLKQQCNET